MMAGIMTPTTPIEPQMPQVLSTGPNVLAMLGWLFDHTIGPKIEAKRRRKQALKVIRQQEKEYEEKWDALKAPQK
jgi:hypothetical protein